MIVQLPAPVMWTVEPATEQLPDAVEERHHRQVRLPAQPRAHRGHQILGEARDPAFAAEVVEDHDQAAGLHDAAHLAQHRDRIGDGGDGVRRQRLVELVLGKVERRRVHHLEGDVRHRQVLHALDRLVEHLGREIDTGQSGERRIERQGEPGPDTHLEHRIARGQRQLTDGRRAARREDPVEDEVVDGSQQLVRALDLPLLQRYVHVFPPGVLEWRPSICGRILPGQL